METICFKHHSKQGFGSYGYWRGVWKPFTNEEVIENLSAEVKELTRIDDNLALLAEKRSKHSSKSSRSSKGKDKVKFASSSDEKTNDDESAVDVERVNGAIALLTHYREKFC